MSLDTYANLKQEIVDLSHRDDLDLKIDTFIDMCESAMFANNDAPLMFRGEEVRATASADTGSRYLALPDGFKEMRVLRLISGSNFYEVQYSPANELKVQSSSGRPIYFTVGSQLEFDRTPDSAYTVEMKYLKDFTALSSSNTANDVLTNHPNIYLFGSMWALKNYANEEQEAERYYQMFVREIKGANKKYKKGRFGPTPAMRIPGVAP